MDKSGQSFMFYLKKIYTMKVSIGLLAGMTLLLVSCSGVKTTPESVISLSQKVEAKNFTVKAQYAQPLSGKQIFLTSEYSLTVKKDSVEAILPYFGVAYSAPYGADGGIRFNEPITDYSVMPNKKNNGWKIQFKVKAPEDFYEIFLNIYNDGSANFTVNSNRRQSISFMGEVKN